MVLALKCVYLLYLVISSFVYYASSLRHPSTRRSSFITSLFTSFVISSPVYYTSSLVARRSSRVVLHLVICLSHLVTHHSSFFIHLVTRHFVTSFITRHSSVTSHAPSESYKRTTAVAVGYIPCAVNTATAN